MGVCITVVYPPDVGPHCPNPVRRNCNLVSLEPEVHQEDWLEQASVHFLTIRDQMDEHGGWSSIDYAGTNPEPWTCA